MFVVGFEKVAKYSAREHHIEQEDLTSRHLAKMEPVHKGKGAAIGAAGGAAYGALLGAATAPGRHQMHVQLAKGHRRGYDVSWTKRKNYGKLLARKTGKGALIGAGLGSLAGLGLSHLNNTIVAKAKHLQKMDPAERRGYLRGEYERRYGIKD